MNARLLIILCASMLPVTFAPVVHADRGGPDDFGYFYVDSSEADGPVYDFEDIATTGNPLALGDDDMSGPQAIGFSFRYYGIDYSEAYISSNGFISLLAGQTPAYEAEGFPTTGDPDAVIAAWWSDFDPSAGGTIHTQTLGTAPHRRFIVQFTDIPYYGFLASTTHQYKFFEGSNVIEIHSTRLDNDQGISAGIENESGTVGLWYADDSLVDTPSAVRYSFISPDPVCTGARASIAEIWPPDHEFVAVEILGVTDPDGDLLLVTIDSIFQDEPVNTLGDGNTEPDGQGVGSSVAEVRAERTGNVDVPGDGRVYHIAFTAEDGQGQCSGEVTVGVPHDQGQGSAIIDGGALYDSTI